MALEYRLTLESDSSAEQVAARTSAELAERPLAEADGDFSVDLYETRGLELIVRAGRNRHYEADGDDGVWEWAPARYVTASFRIDKEQIEDGTQNMLSIVARILASGAEDAALILDSNRLILTRFDGVLRKHGRAKWWTSYDDFANDIIPD